MPRRHQVEVLGADVNASDRECTLEAIDNEAAGRDRTNPAVRLGLCMIRGLGIEVATRIAGVVVCDGMELYPIARTHEGIADCTPARRTAKPGRPTTHTNTHAFCHSASALGRPVRGRVRGRVMSVGVELHAQTGLS